MRGFRALLLRLIEPFRRARRERELAAELQSHVELEVADRTRSGMDPLEARRQAVLRLGGLESVKEAYRDRRGLPFVETTSQDLRYAVRMLRRNPTFAATVVLTLALGIGGTTALFSVFNALTLTPLAVSDPQELVSLSSAFRTGGNSWFPYPIFERLQQRTQTLSGLTAYTSASRVSVSVAGQPERGSAVSVSGQYFQVLGLTPAAGRLLMPHDDVSDAHSAVVSYSFWQQRFGGGADAIGADISINTLPFEIVGVMPAEFSSLILGETPDVVVPLRSRDRRTRDQPLWDKPFATWLQLIGRRAPGVSIEQAQAELDAIYRQQLEEHIPLADARLAEALRSASLKLGPAAGGSDARGLRRAFSTAMQVLLAAAVLLLFLASLNIVTVLLARAAARDHEIAVRLAIGARRGRVVRQLMTETVLLTALGTVGALVVSVWASRFIVRLTFPHASAPPLVPSIDARVLAFTAGIAVLTTVVIGVVPALRATRGVRTEGLRSREPHGRAGRHRLEGGLVVSQIALSIVLLVGAGLFGRTLHGLMARDTGYDRRNILMLSVAPQEAGRVGPAVQQAHQAIRERLAGLSGAEAVSMSVVRPVDDMAYFIDIVTAVDGRPLPADDVMRVATNSVGPLFFATLRIPLRLGREFGEADRDGAPAVAIISETLARTAFSGQNPIGRTISGGGGASLEIVGVAADVRYGNLKDAPRGVVYTPILQQGGGGWTYYLKTIGDPTGMIHEATAAIRAVDPALPVDRVATLDWQASASLSRERVLASLSVYFAALALLLACLGLYGLMAYLAAQRTREFGIRLALGATPAVLRRLILQRTGFLIVVGLVVGVPAAFYATRLVQSLLFEVEPGDPVTIAGAAALMVLCAFAAVLIPARRAARVDPAAALRAL